jgi:hypothetical protein
VPSMPWWQGTHFYSPNISRMMTSWRVGLVGYVTSMEEECI